MKVRLCYVDEYEFLLCLKNSLLVAPIHHQQLNSLQKGDYLIFAIEKMIAGLARVSGRSSISSRTIEEKNVFLSRIPVRFIHIIPKQKRIPIEGKIKTILSSILGESYGRTNAISKALPESAAKKLLSLVSSYPNCLTLYKKNLDRMLKLEEIKRNIERNMTLKKLCKVKVNVIVPLEKTCESAIRRLCQENWFAVPRSASEVHQELLRRGYHYGKSRVCHSLLTLVKEGYLYRSGLPKKYVYFSR